MIINIASSCSLRANFKMFRNIKDVRNIRRSKLLNHQPKSWRRYQYQACELIGLSLHTLILILIFLIPATHIIAVTQKLIIFDAVAQALRPILEAYLRVAFPTVFPPGTLIGPFIGVCRQRIGRVDQIMPLDEIDELDRLKNYANRFHHDSNPAWQTATINDQELKGFAERVLRFISRG